MDQEFKPTEDINPIETSTPVDVPSEPIEIIKSSDDDTSSQNIEVTQMSKLEPEVEAELKPEPEPQHAEELLIEAPKPVVDQPKPTVVKKSILKTLLYLLVIVLLTSAGIASNLWRDQVASDLEKKQSANIETLVKTIGSLQEKLNAATATTTTQTTTTAVAPSASAIESIKSSITSGNTAALEGYMASSVSVVIAASEAAGAGTPTAAVTSITNFIANATSPWNFSLSASILSSYGAGSYKQYFPSIAIVGKSANKKVISFSFDSKGKIDTVFLAASEDLLQ